jgi:hypothetical protein
VKPAWVVVATLGAVSAVAFAIAVLAVRHDRRAVRGMLAQLDALEPDDYRTQVEPEDVVEPDEALEAVLSVAAECPEFGRAWDWAVRTASDELAATIAGRQMAGIMSGTLDWHACVPIPTGMSPEVGHAAFDRAVRDEVTRRINAMTGPGAFG